MFGGLAVIGIFVPSVLVLGPLYTNRRPPGDVTDHGLQYTPQFVALRTFVRTTIASSAVFLGAGGGGAEPTGGESGVAAQLGVVLLGCLGLLFYAARGKPCSRTVVGWLHATTYFCAGWAAFVALFLELYKPVPEELPGEPVDDTGTRGLALIGAGWGFAGVMWMVPEPVWSALGVYGRGCVTTYRLWRQSAGAVVSPYDLAEEDDGTSEKMKQQMMAGSGGTSPGAREVWVTGP